MNTGRAAYREPWLWLITGIPLATLFGGYLTLRLAYQAGESDTVPDDVQRTGQAQVVELAPDQEAARRGLIVSIEIDPASGRIVAMQNAGRPLPMQAIELHFVHPLRSDRDRDVQLLPAKVGWQASLSGLADNQWRIVLTDANIDWRLVGQLRRHAQRATLEPALPP